MLALVASAGCTGGPQTSDADVRIIENERLAEMREQEGTALVDVRRPEAYAEGHLPGAINIPFKELRQRYPQLDKAKRIVVYGSGWSDPLSTAGAKRLLSLGYDDVYEFKGGVELWTDGGKPLVRDPDAAEGRPDSEG